MNQQKLWRIAFVMLAVFSLASCSSNDSEQEKPFTVCPEEQIKFFACEQEAGRATLHEVEEELS